MNEKNKFLKGFGYSLINGKIETIKSLDLPPENPSIFSESVGGSGYILYVLGAWDLSGDSNGFNLDDNQGISRRIKTPKSVLEIVIDYYDWKHYDTVENEERIKGLKRLIDNWKKMVNELVELNKDLNKDIEKYHKAFGEIYKVNSVGGSGSRKKVKELILNLGFKCCTDCEELTPICRCLGRVG